jgi:rhamnogalacturonan endolyase
MWGHYGHGFGIFYMPISTEYYGGGPLKQELIIHQDALILNYIQGEHYGAGNLNFPATYEKLFGPWLVYVAAGADNDAVIAEAKQAAAAEQAKWPYQWMNEPLYPTKRADVTGVLKVADGRSAAKAMVVLGGPNPDIYVQKGGFMFYAQADESGKFTLKNVRPGTYSLFAYATQGTISQQLKQDNIVVGTDPVDLGTVTWTPPKYNNLLWQIGKSDRMAGEFKFGDQPRNIKWIGMVPADLTFTIGQSKDADDWYFAQGKVGNWDVNFDVHNAYQGNAHLTVAIAGVANNPKVTVLVNDQPIKNLSYGNDASLYRSAMRSARFYLEDISFPANQLKMGQNTIRFKMTAVGKNGGIMYDTILLETD